MIPVRVLLLCLISYNPSFHIPDDRIKQEQMCCKQEALLLQKQVKNVFKKQAKTGTVGKLP